ncbi:MAG: transposase [Deltaproteobacteria bacterium]|nr:transposase [Deltaproteobacteria bacterium]
MFFVEPHLIFFELLIQNGGGYRKLTHYLRRMYGVKINKKKVYRLCRENGNMLPRGVKK